MSAGADMACGRGRHSVALFGTFDVPNFGDCLFPLIVEHELAQRLGDVCVHRISPTRRLPAIADYPSVHAFHELPALCREQVPAFIVGGGALLATEHVLFCYPQLRLVYPYALKCWLLPAMLAKASDVPLMFNAVGLERFDLDFAPFTKKYLPPSPHLGVRDSITQDLLSGMGVASDIVPDSGLLTAELCTDDEWERRHASLRKRFGLPDSFIALQASLFLGPDLEAFAKALGRAALELDLPVVLLPFCHHINDLAAHRTIEPVLRSLGCAVVRVPDLLRTKDTAAILSRSSLFAGTSLHGALVSLAFGKPVVSYSPASMKKNRAVLSTVGFGDACIHSIDDVTESVLTAVEGIDSAGLERLDVAKEQVHSSFDRMARIIADPSRSFGPGQFSMGGREALLLCESIQTDLDSVRALCLAPGRRIPVHRRLAALCIRNNRILSEQYDLFRRDRRTREVDTLL